MQSRPNSVELGCPKYFWSEPLQSSQAGRVRGEQKSGKVSLVTSLPSWFKTFFGKVFPTIFSSSRKICIFLCKSYGTVCFQKWVTITLFPSSNQKYFVLLRQQVLQKTWNSGWKSIRSKKNLMFIWNLVKIKMSFWFTRQYASHPVSMTEAIALGLRTQGSVPPTCAWKWHWTCVNLSSWRVWEQINN